MKNWLDWSAYRDAGMGDAYADIPKQGGDFAKAVAVCINAQRCETKPRGVMCPSYRISDEAQLSTGGRVRLLKHALNQGSEAEAIAALDDEALERSMLLCVGCKGCKRECENSVDMAALKIEYLARRHARHGTPLRTRLFAHFPRLLERPLLVSLLRWRNRLPPLAWLGERLLGISADLPLPEPTTKPLPTTGTTGPFGLGSAGELVLLIDSFTRHFEPAQAEAAIEVLVSAGYKVHIAKPAADDGAPNKALCCGRSLLAQGLVEEARAEASRLLQAALPHLEAGRPLVGLEPSCILTLRDETQALGLGPEAKELATGSLLFEEFLARELKAGRMRIPLRKGEPNDPPLLVHGHCHQKAMGAMKSMRKVLKMVPDLEFEFIEAACCGMAGSFGHEAEHQSMSREMAEESLLPALRAHPEAGVVANGFSCRSQIRHLDSSRPVHLAELLRARLEP